MRHLLIGPAVVLALFGALANTSAAGTAVVSFSPQSVTTAVGATVAVDVTVAAVDPDPGLAAYDLNLHFDPAVVRLDSFKDSGLVTGGQNIVICVTGQIDNAAGTVEATCTAIQLLGAPGVSTTNPVPLLHASFTALAAGSSPLTLSGSLSGPTGAAIAASFGSGTIQVTAVPPAASPTTAPTTTAIASPAASPTPSVSLTATPTVAATTVAAVPASPSPTSVIAVRVPPTGSGGDGSAVGKLTGTVWIAGMIAAIAASLLLLWRYRWKRHT